jgi:hypothetical protein
MGGEWAAPFPTPAALLLVVVCVGVGAGWALWPQPAVFSVLPLGLKSEKKESGYRKKKPHSVLCTVLGFSTDLQLHLQVLDPMIAGFQASLRVIQWHTFRVSLLLPSPP